MNKWPVSKNSRINEEISEVSSQEEENEVSEKLIELLCKKTWGRLSNWHTKHHSTMMTFLSPFSGRKQLLPFLCQQGWLMEVEWSAFHHSKWESVLGNGRNTHLHLSAGVSESCHSSRVNGHLSSLTKEHKVSESPDMCQGGGGRGRRACGQKNHHLANVSHLSVKNIPSNCIFQLPKRLAVSQVSI